MPFIVTGFCASNSVANAWCAHAGTAPRSSAQAIKETTIRCIVCSPCLRSVVLTIVRREFFAFHPLHGPVGAPRFRIRARVVDGDVVLQRIKVWTRDMLDQM